MNGTRIRASMAAAALAVGVLAPTAANAGDERRVVRDGGCDGRGEWKIQLGRQHGGIEMEFEVDVNRRGQRWRVRLFHDGRRVYSGVRSTAGVSGSFTVRDVSNNHRGDDRFRARAVRIGSGQKCVGRARF